jgi:FAD:protein FMN transferase
MAGYRRSNRRQFLQGEAARNAVEDFADGIRTEHTQREESQPQSPTGPAATYLMELARDAMAVEFQVLLNAGQHAQSPEAAVAALDLLEPLEAQMSVYRDSSEISRANRLAFEQPVVVEPRLFRLLELAQQIARETGGAYDITSGRLTKLWGFYRRQGRLPSDDEIAETMRSVGYQKLELDAAACTVRFLAPGMEINLGGIGKGYALDRMAQSLTLAHVSDFLLHGGQSSVLARGSRSGAAEDTAGWMIGLADPLRPQQRLAEVRLLDRALGTSGSGTQFFHYQGKRYGHLLDPRTGRPAEGILSSTVVAPTAAEADALSTAFYVGGLEVAQRYCDSHRDVAALLTTAAGAKLSIERFNFDDALWRHCSGDQSSSPS